MSEVVVTAPARLHLGMLDPLGLGARRYGGVGVAIASPRVVVALPATSGGVSTSGPESERAARFARRASSSFGLRGGVSVEVREAIPAHHGLGSGTKLGLAIARGVAALAGVDPDPVRLAEACGRGVRSSVGCWTFVAPGLVVEAGIARPDLLSPLLIRAVMPDAWRCVLARPRDAAGLHGDAEERFFAGDHAPAIREPSISRRVLTGLVPGLLAADIDEFGAALTAVQREVGELFADRQGGIFHPRSAPLVDALARLGVGALGQSSWGPAVYGIVDGPRRAAEVAERLLAAPEVAEHTDVSVVDFDRRGATVDLLEVAT